MKYSIVEGAIVVEDGGSDRFYISNKAPTNKVRLLTLSNSNQFDTQQQPFFSNLFTNYYLIVVLPNTLLSYR